MTYEEWLAHKSTEFDESKVRRDSRGLFAEKASSESKRLEDEWTRSGQEAVKYQRLYMKLDERHRAQMAKADQFAAAGDMENYHKWVQIANETAAESDMYKRMFQRQGQKISAAAASYKMHEQVAELQNSGQMHQRQSVQVPKKPIDKIVSSLRSSGKETIDSVKNYVSAGKDWLNSKLKHKR